MFVPVVRVDDVYMVETDYGTEVIEASAVGHDLGLYELADFVEGKAESFEFQTQKWVAYASMLGYLDRTETHVCDSEAECWEYLISEQPSIFTWSVDYTSESPTACIQMVSEAAAMAMKADVQSIDGCRVEQDGTFLYASVMDPKQADAELNEMGFLTQEG